MNKAQYVFNKIAAEYSTQDLYGHALGGTALNLAVPGLGSYFGTPKKVRENHPVVSAIFGQAGGMGAHAKDTGVSTLGQQIGVDALTGATVGVPLGLLLGLVKKSPALGAAVALGAPVAAAIGSPIGYGLGHLFGKKKHE